MSLLPDYIGPAALGIKLGVIFPGCDLADMAARALEKCQRDGLLQDGDVACITESVVARSQDNYVTVRHVASEVRKVLGIGEKGKIGVVFPILSRNRFALILKGIAASVPRGEVVLQLSFPADEVGNELLPPDMATSLGFTHTSIITREELAHKTLLHPVTKVDYLKLYQNTIEEEGAKATIFLCNDPVKIASYKPDGVIAADIHTRKKTQKSIQEILPKCITLAELCTDGEKWSEWGLLGSNMSSTERLKLAPREADKFAVSVRERVKTKTGKEIEVIIYGDGAYKDPTTGIYELADPMPVFGATPGVRGRLREGVKYKFIADRAIAEGKCPTEVEGIIDNLKGRTLCQGGLETEGTTPRRMEDIIASLADLISGSADAGTPIVLVKGFL